MVLDHWFTYNIDGGAHGSSRERGRGSSAEVDTRTNRIYVQYGRTAETNNTDENRNSIERRRRRRNSMKICVEHVRDLGYHFAGWEM